MSHVEFQWQSRSSRHTPQVSTQLWRRATAPNLQVEHKPRHWRKAEAEILSFGCRVQNTLRVDLPFRSLTLRNSRWYTAFSASLSLSDESLALELELSDSELSLSSSGSNAAWFAQSSMSFTITAKTCDYWQRPQAGKHVTGNASHRVLVHSVDSGGVAFPAPRSDSRSESTFDSLIGTLDSRSHSDTETLAPKQAEKLAPTPPLEFNNIDNRCTITVTTCVPSV